MKIVVLDGYTENPGDLSWSALEALGDVTVYDRTSYVDPVLQNESVLLRWLSPTRPQFPRIP